MKLLIGLTSLLLALAPTQSILAQTIVTYHGSKGNYTVTDSGTYKGCTDAGCLTLEPKHLIVDTPRETIWQNGDYYYRILPKENKIEVLKGFTHIFKDQFHSKTTN